MNEHVLMDFVFWYFFLPVNSLVVVVSVQRIGLLQMFWDWGDCWWWKGAWRNKVLLFLLQKKGDKMLFSNKRQDKYFIIIMGGGMRNSMWNFSFCQKGITSGLALQVQSGNHWTLRVLTQIFSKSFCSKVICKTKSFQCQNDFLKSS